MAPNISFKASVFVFGLVFAVISTLTYGFASSITGNSGNAGEGAMVISGYKISNVAYEPGNDPSKIASTTLTLDAPAAKVQIKLSDTQTDWYNCVNVSGYNWSCDTNNHSILAGNKLQVIALEN